MKLAKNTYEVGDGLKATFEVRSDGILVDPATFELTIYDPAGSADVHTEASPAVDRLGVGRFQLTYPLDAHGRWTVVAQATGPDVVEYRTFLVRRIPT